MQIRRKLASGRFDWLGASDEDLVDRIAMLTYRYFERFSHPRTGFALDRSSRARLSSIAASGFALAAHGLAADRGWIDEAAAAGRVRKILRSFRKAEGRASWRGFYYHFLDAATGAPIEDSEVSVIDTALLLAGAVIARGRFSGDDEIVSLATALLEKAEWDAFFDERRRLFHMAWKPERGPGYGHRGRGRDGFFCGSQRQPICWGTYTDEVVLMALLAAASPAHPVPLSSLRAVDMSLREFDGMRVANSYNGSLFTYFLGSCYLDTEALGQSADGFAWFANSRRAIEANKRFAGRMGLPEWAFGITACDGPDGGYHNYGAYPSTVSPRCDGTIALYGILGSMLHAPQDALRATRRLLELGLYDDEFGVADAVNLLRRDARTAAPWTNWDRLGINQGEMLLVLENGRTGMPRRTFMSDPALASVLKDHFPGWNS